MPASIAVIFEGLQDLSPAELKAAIVRFGEARNSYAAEGRAGMAALYNGLLIALDEERHRRRAVLAETAADFSGDDDDNYEWTPEA